MSINRTPGKWEVDVKNKEIYSDKGEGNVVCCAPYGMVKSMEYWEANARLIASAPDIYEMLNSPFLFASLTPYLQVQVTMILNKINQP